MQARTYEGDETVGVERVQTGEHVELPLHEQPVAVAARLLWLDGDEPVLELGDVTLDGLGRLGRVVHLGLELRDVGPARLEGHADLLLELVNHHKVGEEGKDVVDLD